MKKNEFNESRKRADAAKKRAFSGTVNSLVSLSDEILAKSLCEAMGEDVHHKGDARGNDWRWEDYLECVDQFKKIINFYTS